MQRFMDTDGLAKLKRVEDISLKYSQFTMDEIQELRKEVREIKQKLDDAKRDQERYQFIRAQGYYDAEDENDIGKFEIFQMTDLMCAEGRDHESLDEAIDMAMKNKS